MRAKPMNIDEARVIAKIGLNVAYYRKQNNLPQEAVTEKAEISINTLSTLEAGNRFTNPTILTLVRIAAALNVPLQNLFEFRPDVIEDK